MMILDSGLFSATLWMYLLTYLLTYVKMKPLISHLSGSTTGPRLLLMTSSFKTHRTLKNSVNNKRRCK